MQKGRQANTVPVMRAFSPRGEKTAPLRKPRGTVYGTQPARHGEERRQNRSMITSRSTIGRSGRGRPLR